VQGLFFENKPPSPLTLQMYKFLQDEYEVYAVLRKPGMPPGYTLQDMADDCAALIREEFGGPLDLIGASTGGSIVHHLAADHPELVRRLVIHSSAYRLSDEARRLQREVARLAQQGRRRQAAALLMGTVLPPSGLKRRLLQPLIGLGAWLMSLTSLQDLSDLVVTIEAEDEFNFRDRLAEIGAPTLVIAGEQDPFYTPALFRETAEGIPNARLILYPGMGHPASGRQFARDLLSFLRE
jgi:pimeloyl-ACP methyl ester carboxylesterase